LRLGLLTTSYPRHAGDYAGSFVADRAQTLLDAGHSVEVLAAGDGGPVNDPRNHSSATLDPLTVTRIAAGPSLFYGAGAPEALEEGGAAWLAAARFSVALAAAVHARAARWDSLESHWLLPCALAASAAAPALARRAYAHSGDVALLERIPLGRALARRLARDGTELRFVSDALRARFARLCGARVGTVEPLTVPGSLFSRRPRPDPELRCRLGLSGPTLLAVGRLVPIKGHALLVRACARVSAAGGAGLVKPEVVILGDGPEREPLVRLAIDVGVSLRLPGFVPRGEVADWLRAADVYVQPSVRLANGRTEGAPIATREAQAIGIPVVAASDVVALGWAIRDLLGRSQIVKTV
jgi:teichuronic acid biosynthesis glycosyltransferase TuaC